MGLQAVYHLDVYPKGPYNQENFTHITFSKVWPDWAIFEDLGYKFSY